jgi:hypothetical protein
MMRTLFACALLAAAAHAAEWSKRFEITGMPELRIEADDAAIVIHGTPGNAIEARLTTTGWSIRPDEVRVDARQNANRVEIEVHVPNRNWDVGHRSVKLEVSVPPELRAEIRTGDGHVTAQGLKGEFRFNTGDGGIDAESIDGTLNARTGDGRVSVRGRFDQIDLHTNDGAISAVISAGSKLAAPWRFETGDGSIDIRVPEGLAADLDAQTGDGHISIGLPVTTTGYRSSENNFRGKLNGGGPPLRIHTGDGAIRVERI